ncbi:DUF2306 domain-containing protein [Sphingobium chlorophenolicum]|uniref:DUF2306 domain-containing protein n=1 Tax=Sphingobium chlorophenolicum TaxID=46429 RepID=A0A081REH8_SPHCR|nr:DUF2306 domain-containing protein [Sphingobium chlorophenolicum]KEQ53601.1 hypothetical protein BV95_02182 [Sphingobium chlorophenolicum]
MEMIAPEAALAQSAKAGALLRRSSQALVATVWASGILFGAYILVFFGGSALGGLAERWNGALRGLHDPALPSAVIAIGLHFAAGGILLLLGPIQLIGPIRRAAPRLHRWLGRLYVGAAALAGVGGSIFILVKGTIGGPVMDVGFGIYGALMILCAERAFTLARQRRFDAHRAWAIRLFALTVGSWLYRMEYALWFLAMGNLGTNHFHGWFDAIMAFFFYIPNLLVAEFFIRAGDGAGVPKKETPAALALIAATIFVAIATWFFTVSLWGPGMARGVEGLAG